ncbi:MAG TPA: AAA family ATPase, partial [Terriglobales bacterium]|nr:AAA family ATPase [Terriglobales bacterium]
MIELRALGTAEIRTGVTILRPSQDIVFAAALFLVIQRGKPIARDRFAEILWPDAGLGPRRHRLRQTLLQLKKLGFVVRATRDTVVFEAEVATDADLIKQMSADGPDPESVAWLPGYNPAFSRAFGEWLDAARDEVHSATVIALLRRMSIARSHGDWRALERIATKILSIDAYNEEAVLARAESAAMRGAKRKALSVLDEYLSEIGDTSRDLRVPATILRRRITERLPDRPVLRNAEPAFVGRDEEMAVLTRALDEARAGAGSAILVIGDPGIGKSRLSAEVARFAELRGARVQRAMCRRTDVERPLSLFVDIVPQLRELPGALGCAPETFALLKRLTEFEQRAEDVPRALDIERLFEEVRAALFDLLESIAEEHCLLIVIDDVQWLDKISAALLVRMSEWCRSRRILFVLNARPDGSSLLDYADGSQFKRITLGPLAGNAAAAVLEAFARNRGGEPEPAFVGWGVAVAEGNPFFLQELAQHWIETGQH